MSHCSGLPVKLVEKMQDAFFDVSSDGVLTCLDPSIGPLHNPQKRIVVKLNAKKAAFELVVLGRVAATFELNGNIQKACQDAFSGYFTAFEELCRGPQRGVAAA